MQELKHEQLDQVAGGARSNLSLGQAIMLPAAAAFATYTNIGTWLSGGTKYMHWNAAKGAFTY